MKKAFFYSGLLFFMFVLPFSLFAAEKAVELTEEEKEYISLKKSIKMCVDPDWKPFEIINERGEHEGIAADLVQIVAKRTGLKIELYKVKTWDESVEASKSG